MLLLWAILLLVLGIGLAIMAFTGVAIAISFLTKIMFFLAFLCIVAGLILIILERLKVHEKEREEKEEKQKI